ncbi:hypothetical protein ACMD2_04395, partial [Ananas comosus]
KPVADFLCLFNELINYLIFSDFNSGERGSWGEGGAAHERTFEKQGFVHRSLSSLFPDRINMVLDSLSSPHRRSQNTFFSSSSSSSKKQFLGREELGSWSTLFDRHKFLLTMLVVLAFLCTIYLYFAVTLGPTKSCSELSGAERAICEAKSSLHQGKLKFF